MKRASGIGILGLGVFLPAEVRRNDWWPTATSDAWRDRRLVKALQTDRSQAGEGAKKAFAAITALREDPFQGGVERRIAAPEMEASDMEADAARHAIAESGVAASEIGLILSYSLCPDFCQTQNAAAVHKKLGLSERCISIAIEAGCNTFMMQLTLAQQMIASGSIRYALLVQSSIGSRMTDPRHPVSAWFGDGATAAVVGPVPEGYGIVQASHHVDGARHRAMVFGVPGKKWHEDGKVVIYSPEPETARDMVTTVPERAKLVIEEILEEAQVSKSEIGFYASHQGTSWLGQVTREHAGLTESRTVNPFSWVGSLSAANIPLILSVGLRERLLSDGDLTVLFSGGTGETWSAILLRWGGKLEGSRV